MTSAERYLKPDVIRQIKRLDLRAQFIVKGFLTGLHASPFHGFSVEFSEHRKYTDGDDPNDIDWLVYAKTDKYYIKKFEAETNITGYVVMDLSESMDYTNPESPQKFEGEDSPLTKFEYSISLAAALIYLMIRQQDPVGLVAFDEKIRHCIPPKSKRNQLPILLSLLSKLKPSGQAKVSESLDQLAAMLRHRNLVMIFSDLLREDDEALIRSLRRLRHGGHDVILFHILDAAESVFPFRGMVEFEEPETGERMVIDADAFKAEYLKEKEAYCNFLDTEAKKSGIDYVPLDTSMQFDRALVEYLLNRRHRA